MRYAARPVAALLGVALAAYLVQVWRQPETAVDSYLFGVCELLCCAVVTGRVVLVREHRLPWVLFAGCAIGLTFGDTVYDVWLRTPMPPSPNVVDLAYLLAYGCGVMAVLILITRLVRPWRLALSLDGVLVGLTLGAVILALPLGGLLDTVIHTGWEGANQLGYLVLDLVMLAAVGAGWGLTGWRPGRTVGWLTGFVLALILADLAWGYAEASDSDWPWAYPLYPIAMSVLALAACTREDPVTTPEVQPASLAPAFAWASALLMLLLPALGHGNLAASLVSLAACLAASGRSVLTQRENARMLQASRREALTDGLTGLGNRRRLMEDLGHVLSRDTDHATVPHALMLLDLDRFKAYNDAHGHLAGDLLLQRVAAALDQLCVTRGRAYRLGGDEFCLLLHARLSDGDVATVVDRAVRRLRADASVSASVGHVLVPDDASDVDTALLLADQRMYERKRMVTGRANPAS